MELAETVDFFYLPDVSSEEIVVTNEPNQLQSFVQLLLENRASLDTELMLVAFFYAFFRSLDFLFRVDSFGKRQTCSLEELVLSVNRCVYLEVPTSRNKLDDALLFQLLQEIFCDA